MSLGFSCFGELWCWFGWVCVVLGLLGVRVYFRYLKCLCCCSWSGFVDSDAGLVWFRLFCLVYYLVSFCLLFYCGWDCLGALSGIGVVGGLLWCCFNSVGVLWSWWIGCLRGV